MSENGQVVPDSLYVYAPNKIVPVVFAALFAVSTVGHIWQCCRYKSWGLIGLHPFVAVLFTAGYVLREAGAFNYKYDPCNKESVIIYITNQVLVYIGPPLLELSNYHILGRMFSYVPWLSPLPADKVFAIFGSLMAIVETLNGLGVAFTSNPMGSKQEAGKILVLASLGLQICVIISFFMMSIMFHVRCVKANVCSRVVSTLPFTLYVSMALIVIRSIYRVVEHTGNTSLDISNEQELQSLSPLLRYEWYFYVFEATTMLLNSLLWNAFNASRFLPRSSKVFLAEDGTTEMTVLDGPTTGDQPAAAQIGRLMMQLLTFGLWGQIFPKRQSSKEESFEKNSEPESTGSFHQV